VPRYVALLRGVSPMNAKMAQLQQCFEGAGFAAVKTVLATGNVVFDARSSSEAAVARKAAAAMQQDLAHPFPVIVRRQSALQQLVEDDPFSRFQLPAAAKRVVTFLREAPDAPGMALPLEKDGARILALQGRELLTAYVPSDKGAAFMVLIEKTFGKDVTTRTWDTVRKCAGA
jgi:uncharacterized protein (DUF1697 family)